MIKKAVLLSLVLASSLYSQSVTLDEAIDIALKNNKNLKVSDISLDIAQTLYKQAMSAHYPTLDVGVKAMRLDEAPTFEMRGTATIDSQAQFLGTAAQLDLLSTAQGTPTTANVDTAQNIIASGQYPATTTMPIDMDVKMMGRDSAIARADFVLPIYTGGKISAIVKQAKAGRAIAQVAKVRTRNQVIYDVKKYYYGALMTKQIKQLTSDTLERMKFISDLTSALYKGGSMSVKKTDYLRAKMSVNMISVFYEDIKTKETMAKAALANAMGYSWNQEVDVADKQLPVPKMNSSMASMVEQAYEFNPDYKTLKLALRVQDAKIDESQSGYLPKVALVAGAQYMYNDYEYGVINKTNNRSWNIGVGLEWSIFNGMRTSNQVQQSKLEKLKLQQQELLLQDGIALQVKQAYMEMGSSYKKYTMLVDAVKVARENRELNTRAYQEDMVETKDVIESQLFEAITEADYYRSQNDYALAHAKADLVIGSAVENSLKN